MNDRNLVSVGGGGGGGEECYRSLNYYWRAYKVCKQYTILHFIAVILLHFGDVNGDFAAYH